MGIACVLSVLISMSSLADSIIVDGVTHEDVLVDEGGNMYYVKVPKEGRFFSVMKTKVTPEAVTISSDPIQRQVWRDEYKRNQSKVNVSTPTRARIPSKDSIPSDKPLDASRKFIDPLDLKIGITYRVSKQTPLMPDVDPVDPIAALQEMIQIPVGGVFSVLGIDMKNGGPWYKVIAVAAENRRLGSGYINSTALFGQTITVCEQDTGQEKNTSADLPLPRSYRVVSSKDLNYISPSKNRLIRRREYRVHLARKVSEPELQEFAQDIVKLAQDLDAITIFFYLPESEPTGLFTAGKAEWAPGGKWEEADSPEPKRVVMEYGSAISLTPEEERVQLPLERKKAIFMSLVKYQDQGMAGDESFAATAGRHGVTQEQVRKIMLEGLERNWPLP
jgi:hypothetical protein